MIFLLAAGAPQHLTTSTQDPGHWEGGAVFSNTFQTFTALVIFKNAPLTWSLVGHREQEAGHASWMLIAGEAGGVCAWRG